MFVMGLKPANGEYFNLLAKNRQFFKLIFHKILIPREILRLHRSPEESLRNVRTLHDFAVCLSKIKDI